MIFIPAVLAGWLRYLIGVDDQGEVMTLSPDPLLEDLQSRLSDIQFENNSNIEQTLLPVLSNAELFGVDLIECQLADKIISCFKQLNSGKKAVRNFLKSLPRVQY